MNSHLRRALWSLALIFALWVAAFAMAFLSPWGKPVVEVQIESSSPGFSQLFVAGDDSAFSEKRSTWAVVREGPNALQFPLNPWRGTTGSQLRWDPLDEPADFTVTEVGLRSGFFSQVIPVEDMRPSMAVSEIVLAPEGATFSAQSNDPQVLITVDTHNFYQESLGRAAITSTLLALACGLAIWLAWPWFQKQRRSVSRRNVERAGNNYAPVSIPPWVFGTLLLFVGVGIAILFLGAIRIGVSWDEPIHELSLEEFFRSGWFVPRGSFVDGLARVADASVYAPVGALVAHSLGVLMGVHPWFEASFLGKAYEARHVAVAFMSLIGLVAVFVTVRCLFRSWKWATLAIALVVSIPLFLGHSMFNIKDAPVAAAFSLFTLGLVLISGTSIGTRTFFLSALAQAAGIVLGLGNRPGLWVAFTASWLGTLLLLGLLDVRVNGLRKALARSSRRASSTLLAVTVGLLVLWFVYPVAFGQPVQLLRDSLLASQAFPWSGETLTAGVYMPAQPPWTYVPLWLGAQLPLLVMLFAAIGVVYLAIGYLRALTRRESQLHLVRGGVPILLQAAVTPFGAVVLGSTLYGGVRQFLFIFPAVAIIAGVGIYAVAQKLQSMNASRLTTALWVVVLVGITLPLASQIRLFPYSFAYFNAGAATGSIDRNWDVDGWWSSGRELVEDQLFPRRTICVDSPARPISDCSRMEMITPYLSPFNETDLSLAEDQYVALSRFPDTIGPDQCTPIRQVTRGLFWQEIQLSQASVCTAALAPYPVEGLNFSGLAKDDSVVLWGWNPYLLWGWGEPDADGIWMVDQQGSVGFTQDIDPASEVEMVLMGSGSAVGAEGATMRVFVNGVESGSFPVPGQGTVEQVSIPIPSEVLVGDRVLIRFEVEGLDADRIDEAINGGEPGVWRLDRLDIS